MDGRPAENGRFHILLIFILIIIAGEYQAVSQSDAAIKPLDIFSQNVTATNMTCEEYLKQCDSNCTDPAVFADQCGCICDEVCVLYGACCPNFRTICQKRYDTVLQEMQPRIAGFDLTGHANCIEVNFFDSYHLVSKCPDTASPMLQQNCATNRSDAALFQKIPVVGTNTGIHYRNVYCAQCFHESNASFWNTEVRCGSKFYEISKHNIPLTTEFVNILTTLQLHVFQGRYSYCDLKMVPVNKGTLRKCPLQCQSRTGRCDKTGIDKPYSLAILINLNNDNKLWITADKSTDGTKSFTCDVPPEDTSMNFDLCAASGCKENFTLQDSKCVSVKIDRAVIVTVVSKENAQAKLQWLAPIIYVLGSVLQTDTFTHTIGSFQIETLHLLVNTFRNMTSDEWEKILADFEFLARKYIEDSKSEDTFTSLDVYSYIAEDKSTGEVTLEPLPCNWTQLTENDVEVIHDRQVWLVKQNQTQNVRSLVRRAGQVYICVNDTENVTVSSIEDASYKSGYFYKTSGIITTVLLTISIFCLLVRLFLCKVKSFATFTARLKTCLCFTLLLAHIAFLIAPWVVTKHGVCTVVAIVLHWSFLSSATWSSVITLEIWQSLRPCKSAESCDQQKKMFIVYAVVAWCLPLMFVLCGVFLDFAVLDLPPEWYPNYGDGVCWFNSRTPLIWFFVAPLCALALVSQIVVIMIIVLLCRSLSSTDANGGSLHKGFPVYLSYFILVLLCGASWLCALIAVLTYSFMLWYIFIVLNAEQGIYIFLEFVCRKRVLQEVFNCNNATSCSHNGIPAESENGVSLNKVQHVHPANA